MYRWRWTDPETLLHAEVHAWTNDDRVTWHKSSKRHPKEMDLATADFIVVSIEDGTNDTRYLTHTGPITDVARAIRGWQSPNSKSL